MSTKGPHVESRRVALPIFIKDKSSSSLVFNLTSFPPKLLASLHLEPTLGDFAVLSESFHSFYLIVYIPPFFPCSQHSRTATD